MNVARLGPDDAPALRDIRLEALRLHPTAFSADPDIEGAFSLDEWRKRLAERVWFGGWADGALAGMNAYSAEDYSAKTRHNGHLGAMYVRGPARGSGLADMLVRNFLDFAAGKVEQVILTVETKNARAIKLYERHGFRTIGQLPRSMKVDGHYYNELQMLRAVSESD